MNFNPGCDTGWFGVDCSEKCDHCMNNATCGIERGDCDAFGCANFGIQPPLCKGKIRIMNVLYSKHKTLVLDIRIL